MQQPEAKPSGQTVRLPIQKYRTEQLILFNENGSTPNLEPFWTGPHEFTNNKGPEHAEI